MKSLDGLQKSGRTAAMEGRFSLSSVKPSVSRRKLLDIARAAQRYTFDWPIGIVSDREESRPRLSRDGIFAEILGSRDSYNCWAIRQDGDFFLLRSLFEDELAPNSVFFDTRFIQITETLLYCRRLYDRFNISQRAEVRIVIEHQGLRGRLLTAGRYSRGVFDRRPPDVDCSNTSIEIVLGRIDSDLANLVKHFAEPLFELFDFASFEDSVYEDLVAKFRSSTFV